MSATETGWIVQIPYWKGVSKASFVMILSGGAGWTYSIRDGSGDAVELADIQRDSHSHSQWHKRSTRTAHAAHDTHDAATEVLVEHLGNDHKRDGVDGSQEEADKRVAHGVADERLRGPDDDLESEREDRAVCERVQRAAE